MEADIRSILYFAPPDDPRINVTAKLQVPQGIHLGGGRAAPDGSPALGSMSLRFEPDPTHPYTFVDVKTGALGARGSVACLRACVVDAGSGFAGFAQLPVGGPGGKGNGALLQSESLRLGGRYTSPLFSAGAIVSPEGAVVHDAWLVSGHE